MPNNSASRLHLVGRRHEYYDGGLPRVPEARLSDATTSRAQGKAEPHGGRGSTYGEPKRDRTPSRRNGIERGPRRSRARGLQLWGLSWRPMYPQLNFWTMTLFSDVPRSAASMASRWCTAGGIRILSSPE